MKPHVYICIPTTKERRPRLQKLIESIRESDYPNKTLVIHECVHDGCVSATHHLLEGIKDDALVFGLSDDNWIEPDCITKLVEGLLRVFPDAQGVAHSYNEIQGSQLITASLQPSYFIKKYFYKGYIHNFSDNEYTDIIKRMNKYVYVPEAIVHHEHVSSNRSLQDETYATNQRTMEQDRFLWEQRKKNNYE